MKLRYNIPQDKEYGTVYADPPWMLSMGGGMRKLKYDTMTTREIKGIGEQLTNVTHSCWLWTTNPHLPEALEVMHAWGFNYKTMLTWDKERIGLGWWLRSATEHVLWGVRPGVKATRPGGVSTIIRGGYQGHSIKPAEGYHVIEARSPGPYLELFANRLIRRPNWTQLARPKQPTGDPYGTGYTPPQCSMCPHTKHDGVCLVPVVSTDTGDFQCPCEGED